jgi:hypothetical protein
MLCISLGWPHLSGHPGQNKSRTGQLVPQGHFERFRDTQDKKSPGRDTFISDVVRKISSFDIMPRRRKHCPICGKKNLLKLSNHLADIHELSSEQRQPFLIRAKVTPLEIVFAELYTLIRNLNSAV